MDAARHAKLADLSDTERAALQQAAALAATSVDAVVRAGLGRGGVPENAQAAANVLRERFPSIFKGLDGWPFVCAFCFQDTEKLAAPCPFCKATGCRECVDAAGCPTCKKLAAERAVRIEAERKEREEALADLDRREKQTIGADEVGDASDVLG